MVIYPRTFLLLLSGIFSSAVNVWVRFVHDWVLIAL